MGEPPVYRPFALMAFGATLLAATPAGLWLLATLYLGASGPTVEWALLHGAVQTFGLFATLIVGVSHHLLARFTGRPTAPTRLTGPLALLLALALLLRLGGVALGRPVLIALAPTSQAVAFGMFAAWVWRTLGLPPIAVLRAHLTLASAWLALASAVEAAARWSALADGLTTPDLRLVRAVYPMALFGGVLGWVLGVLLRAGPMFVADWRVPPALARVVPSALAAAVAVAALAEGAPGAWVATTLSRLGDTLALGSVVAVVASAGAFRHRGARLPMLGRNPEEARIFKVAAGSAIAATVLAAAGLVAAMAGVLVPLLGDAIRHLFTVGVLGGVTIAMIFRLVPVLESTPLRWPRLRGVALVALLGSVVLRTAELLVGAGWGPLAPAVALSGVLAWLALACAGANLVAAILAPHR
jgi:hypothetical protein